MLSHPPQILVTRLPMEVNMMLTLNLDTLKWHMTLLDLLTIIKNRMRTRHSTTVLLLRRVCSVDTL